MVKLLPNHDSPHPQTTGYSPNLGCLESFVHLEESTLFDLPLSSPYIEHEAAQSRVEQVVAAEDNALFDDFLCLESPFRDELHEQGSGRKHAQKMPRMEQNVSLLEQDPGLPEYPWIECATDVTPSGSMHAGSDHGTCTSNSAVIRQVSASDSWSEFMCPITASD